MTKVDELNAQLRQMGKEEFVFDTVEDRNIVEDALHEAELEGLGADPLYALAEICKQFIKKNPGDPVQ
jgi:hypothetical protein